MKRRDLITSISATPFMLAVPVSAETYDSLPDLVKKWKLAYSAWIAGSDLPDGGNFDNQECLDAEKRKDYYRQQIISTVPTSIKGVLAQLEYAKAEFAYDYQSDWADDRDIKLFQHLLDGVSKLAAKS